MAIDFDDVFAEPLDTDDFDEAVEVVRLRIFERGYDSPFGHWHGAEHPADDGAEAEILLVDDRWLILAAGESDALDQYVERLSSEGRREVTVKVLDTDSPPRPRSVPPVSSKPPPVSGGISGSAIVGSSETDGC